MHGIDIIACALAALFVLMGIRRGVIAELFRLLAMVGGFVAAALYYRHLYARLAFLPAGRGVRLIAAYLCVYILVAAALVGIGWLVRKVVHWSMLGWADRLLGGGTGLLKSLLVVWVGILLLSALPLPAVNEWAAQSLAHAVFRQIPPRLKLPDIDNAHKTILNVMDREALDALGGTREKIDSFRVRIDSLAKPGDTL